MLLTNDGEFVQRLTHPKFKVPRHYYIKLAKPLDEKQLETIRKGPYLRDGKVKEVKVFPVRKSSLGSGNWYAVTVFEGRNRLVRRVFESQGCTVRRLIRFGIGSLKLPPTMPRGKCVPLTDYQMSKLY